jgi:hypothetical protein
MDQTASFQTPGFTRTKGVPRPAASYRAARRNSVKAARMLPHWRLVVAEDANKSANLYGRAVTANGAREAAAKALVGNRAGIPALVTADAMLTFYRGEKQTRVVRRIIRDLEVQVRSAGRK